MKNEIIDPAVASELKAVAKHARPHVDAAEQHAKKFGTHAILAAIDFLTIRDRKLYIGGGHKSMLAYMQADWPSLPESTWRRMLQFAVIYVGMKQVADEECSTLPVSPDHLFALAKLTEDPKDRLYLWDQAESQAALKEVPVTVEIITKTAESIGVKKPAETRSINGDAAGRKFVESTVVGQGQSSSPVVDADVEKPSEEQETEPESTEGSKPDGAPLSQDPPESTPAAPVIQHGTEFNPAAWEDDSSPGIVEKDTPAHLRDVIANQKTVREVRNAIVQLKKKIHAEMDGAAWHYINIQALDRDLDKLTEHIKFSEFACNCPSCRNDIDRDCPKCKGMGWIPRSRSNLTDLEKAWLARQPKSARGTVK